MSKPDAVISVSIAFIFFRQNQRVIRFSADESPTTVFVRRAYSTTGFTIPVALPTHRTRCYRNVVAFLWFAGYITLVTVTVCKQHRRTAATNERALFFIFRETKMSSRSGLVL